MSAAGAVLPSGIVGAAGSIQADCARAGISAGALSAGTTTANSKSLRFIDSLSSLFSQALSGWIKAQTPERLQVPSCTRALQGPGQASDGFLRIESRGALQKSHDL